MYIGRLPTSSQRCFCNCLGYCPSMLVVLCPTLATSGHQTVIPWEFLTCLGAKFHPRSIKKHAVPFLSVRKGSATGIIQCFSVWDLSSCYCEPQNHWILWKTYDQLQEWSQQTTVQHEEIFLSIDLRFMCSLLQWSTLIASPFGKEGGKRGMAALILFMFSVIINICIWSPSYKQNNPTLQSLLPGLLLHLL